MKKLLAILLFVTSLNAYSQNTVTLPSPTTSVTPSWRVYGSLSDSLRNFWLGIPGNGYNRFYSATEANLRFAPITGGGYQPLNAKLTAFSALANSPGFLKNNGSGVFSYDNNTYYKSGDNVSFGTGGFTGQVTLTNNAPRLRFTNTAAGTDNKNWDFAVGSNVLLGIVYNDALNAGSIWLNATRSGTTVSNIDFVGTNIGLKGDVSIKNSSNTATIAFNAAAGSITANSFIKSGGTSSQFLMADGSVNSSSYIDGSGTTYDYPYFNGTKSLTSDGFSKIVLNGSYKTIGQGVGTAGINDPGGDPPHMFEFNNDNSTQPLFKVTTAGTGSYASNNFHWNVFDGTFASPTVTKANQFFMSMGYRGYDPTNGFSQSAGAFQAYAPQNWSATSHPIRFNFGVTNIGSLTRTDAFQIRENTDIWMANNVIIGIPDKKPWNSNYSTLSVGNGGIRANYSINNTSMFNGLYFDTTWKYYNSALGSFLNLDDTGNLIYGVSTDASPVANGVANTANQFTVSNTGNVTFAGTATGNGSGLTSLTPANISPGTAPISVTGNSGTVTNGVYTNVNNTLIGTNTNTGNFIVKGIDATTRFSAFKLHRYDSSVDFLTISTKTPSANNSAVYFNDGNSNGYEWASGGSTTMSLSPSGALTTIGLDNYNSDLSGSYTSRSKVDKAYVDAAVTAGGGNRPYVVTSSSSVALSVATDYFFTGTTSTFGLPDLSNGDKYRITIKNRGSGNITVNGYDGGANIYTTSAVSSETIAPGAAVTYISDGTYWNHE